MENADVCFLLCARGPLCQSSTVLKLVSALLEQFKRLHFAGTSQETWEAEIPVTVLDFPSLLGYLLTIRE